MATNWGTPDQKLFGQFNLKKVNMVVYGKFGAEWHPLMLANPFKAQAKERRKVRFELIWD